MSKSFILKNIFKFDLISSKIPEVRSQILYLVLNSFHSDSFESISNFTVNNNRIDVSFLNPGIYLIEFKTETSCKILKFIKQ